jgi:hypothetical protein
MKRLIGYIGAAVLLVAFLIGCQGNLMSQSEKLFIKMVDRTAGKLDLNEDQKVQLARLKMEIRKNFVEGQEEKDKAAAKIREEGRKENPDTQKMSFQLKELLRNETERMNRAFDLTLDFQSSLNDIQKKKLTQMITKWVTED